MSFYVFFDVDGVLNCKDDWRIKYAVNRKCVEYFAQFVHKLEKYDDVKLVICSTWRAGISEKNEDTRQFQNLKSIMKEYGLEIFDSTPLSNKGRQAEIEYYIRRNSVVKYIVVDDDPSLFNDSDKLVIYVPDYMTGFDKRDVKSAYKKVLEEAK